MSRHRNPRDDEPVAIWIWIALIVAMIGFVVFAMMTDPMTPPVRTDGAAVGPEPEDDPFQ
ncbi:hypothetical protein [Jiella sp. M17.18]|uniref:hypothetical protein n=1 Tax=Jiella sp. M17.18 TaxID=3234247 RepID=UPI0034DEEF35